MTHVIGNPIRLQTAHGEVFVRYFQVLGKEGVVLFGAQDCPNPCKIRIQSSCLFSESFWATDCDCSSQLSESIKIISEEAGCLIYIYEEGRGAGLRMKIEAIRLQQESGFNTRTAYECLNLPPDTRSYEAVGVLLHHLFPEDQDYILLSNNPDKESKLRQHKISIKDRVPLICINERNAVRVYLLEKEKELGHDISRHLH